MRKVECGQLMPALWAPEFDHPCRNVLTPEVAQLPEVPAGHLCNFDNECATGACDDTCVRECQ